MSEIPHSRPWIDDGDVAAVSRVLRSRMIAQGPVTQELEHRLASWVGMTGGVAVSSGSAGIELALRALDVDGGEVILPTYLCRSVLETVVTSGARPVLCDVGDDWVMEPKNVARAITGMTRCIIVPHMYGVFADVGAFRAFGVPLLEDSAQAVGTEGSRVSAADVVVFSLHPTKCLTAGEGGCAVSRDTSLVARMRRLRDGAPDGRNPRLFSPFPDVSAALALSQLARYPEFLRRRHAIADRYDAALARVRPQSEKLSMHFRYVLRVPGGYDAVAGAFAAQGVTVRRGVDELLHRLLGLDDASFPVAVRHFASSVSLPIYPALSDAELNICIAVAAKELGSRNGTPRQSQTNEQTI